MQLRLQVLPDSTWHRLMTVHTVTDNTVPNGDSGPSTIRLPQSYTPKKRLQITCPVRVECLEHALKHREAGIWGGFNERDRERLNRGINPHRGPGRPPRRENGHGYACKCAVCRRSA